jgi:thymidylate kinase
MSTYRNIINQPQLVEIVGAAGAGKTTILSALSKHNKDVRPVYGFRHWRYIPFYIGHTILLLPFLLVQGLKGRWHSPREINRMIRLTASHKILEREVAKGGVNILLDQGPIYTLSVLAGFGSEQTKNKDFVKWSEEILQQWTKTLDLIIWVDAPDEVLLERIQTREKTHLVKDRSNQEAIEFLKQFRTVYKQTIEKLAANGKAKVIFYDTSKCSVDSIVKATLAELNHNHGSNNLPL